MGTHGLETRVTGRRARGLALLFENPERDEHRLLAHAQDLLEVLLGLGEVGLGLGAGIAEGGELRFNLVGGRVLPLHLAIGAQWKVHYFSAEMAYRPDYREREQRYLDDPVGTLGAGVIAALERVGAALGLDYAGIDFALGPAGELVVFEANATMIVVPPGADARWAYRRPAVERVDDAVRALLVEATHRSRR